MQSKAVGSAGPAAASVGVVHTFGHKNYWHERRCRRFEICEWRESGSMQAVLFVRHQKGTAGERMKMALCLLIAALAVPAWAQEKGGGSVTYKKQTEYSFEDDTIEGDLTKPDGEYVEARKKVKHSNLIKIREEFKDKVMQSVGEL